MGEKARMIAGELYRADDPELVADRERAAAWLARYNGTHALDDDRRAACRMFLAAFGEGSFVRPPFHCDYGYNLSIGSRVFLNFGCVVLDVVPVSIGDGTQIGPAVQLLAADHPRDPAERRAGLEFGRPISIGANVWIGGGALILPGVTIGDDSIVGSGAVVVRDVPPGATVVGNPARLLPNRRAP